MNTNCITEHVYNGQANTIVWVLAGNRTPVADLSAITRIVFTVGDIDIDSDVVGSSVIWWTDQELILWEGVELTVDVLKMALGDQSLLAGIYSGCVLKVFEPLAPSGSVWIDNAVIQVH